jgi:hypothetical protein
MNPAESADLAPGDIVEARDSARTFRSQRGDNLPQGDCLMWEGALAVVERIEAWGVAGYVPAPWLGGEFPVHLGWADFEPTGGRVTAWAWDTRRHRRHVNENAAIRAADAKEEAEAKAHAEARARAQAASSAPPPEPPPAKPAKAAKAALPAPNENDLFKGFPP